MTAAGAAAWRAQVDGVAARLGDLARRRVPLGPLTTYRVGGAAEVFVAAAAEADLEALAGALAGAPDVPVLVVGRGSNLLVADSGFPGVAVVLGPTFDWIELAEKGVRVRAGGATAMPVLSRRTAAAGLRGFEWAVGVPGSAGGAVRMNAGGHGSDMAAVLIGARVVRLRPGGGGSGTGSFVPAADLALAYRTSTLSATDVVVEVELALRAGRPAEAEAEVAEVVRWRRANQPGGSNAGSVFKNPPGDSAGRLIDAAGLKGHRLGSAAVSTRHANFIQADPGGRAGDVRELLELVRTSVKEMSGVLLEPELRMVGFDSSSLSSTGG